MVYGDRPRGRAQDGPMMSLMGAAVHRLYIIRLAINIRDEWKTMFYFQQNLHLCLCDPCVQTFVIYCNLP